MPNLGLCIAISVILGIIILMVTIRYGLSTCAALTGIIASSMATAFFFWIDTEPVYRQSAPFYAICAIVFGLISFGFVYDDLSKRRPSSNQNQNTPSRLP